MSAPGMNAAPLKALIVEDNPGDAFLIEHILDELEWMPLESRVSSTLAGAEERLEQESFSIIFSDLDLPDSSGLETIARLLNNGQDIPVVVLSGNGARDTAIDAIRMGAQDFLEKDCVATDAVGKIIAHSLERHELRRALQTSVRDLDAANLRFMNLIRDLTDAVVVFDPGGEIKFVNPAAESLFGKDPGDLVGQTFELAQETGEPVEVELVDRTGIPKTAELRVVETDWNGAPARLASLRDVTARKRAERGMRVAQEAAESASDMKSRFLANMSHELRTPLNSIIGFSEVISKETFGSNGNARYCEYAGDIHRSGQHLLSLINDLLDLSKADAGQYEIVEQEFDLIDLVHDAIRLVGPQSTAKAQQVALVNSFGTCRVFAGERQIMQVIVNLLSNAIKFTPPEGRIEIRVSPGKLGSVILEVDDTGVGIAPEDMTDLFKAYTQVGDPYLKDKETGTGLGLALSKRLIELHGGFIRVHSTPDVGTTVSVVLPGSRLRTGCHESGQRDAVRA